jgi:stage II sporulation protein P
MKAYGPSELTVKKLLADHPSVQMVLDIHRDAESRENSLTEVNGTAIARIATIVAVGQEDLVQPHWQKNLAFAQQINDKMNKYFPGLSRGIQTVEWRYNQHLHERALLFEVGSQETSQAEAERAMEILGGILVEILAENNNFGVK